ncbi:MAG TPA: alanine racemase [Nitrospinaceae bacterium]|nr:alanine racemase [Nitrospinaceae bacterium]
MTENRATFAEINLDSFRHNLHSIKSLIGPDVGTMAIIKADAYGHGAIQCARAATKEQVNYIGVGIIQEAIELRENGITSPILILGGIYPNEIEDLIKYNLSTSLSSSVIASAISKKAEQANKSVGVHIKIDTGMGRLGIQPEDFLSLLNNVITCKNLKIDGLFTHFSSADEEDPETTHHQISIFLNVLKKLRTTNFSKMTNEIDHILFHSANTAGLLRFPESRFDLVRPGISLFGSFPSPTVASVFDSLTNENKATKLRPVMNWKTKIIQIQTLRKGVPISYGGRYVTKNDRTLIATIPVGYADGLSRQLSNNMELLVKETRVKQVGTICMDMCLIDVTSLPDVKMGDEVVIFGSQGNGQIKVEELATKADTIPYEILCGVGKRVPRIYIP